MLQEPMACALLDKWLQQLFMHHELWSNLTAAIAPCFRDVCGHSCKTYKQQSWGSTSSTRAWSLLDRHTSTKRNSHVFMFKVRVARPWPSNSFKRKSSHSGAREPIACALPSVWWFCQRQFAPSSCSCSEINTVLTVLPLNSVSEMFAATAAKVCKQQGRRSRNSTPCVVTADRHTQAPNETVFYSWLLDQSFGDRGPKDLPLSSSMCIWRRGTVGWKIKWVDAEWYAIWKIQGLF